MRIDVHVKTGKKESKVIKKDFARYEVWVKARPERGKANKEVIEVLSSYFSKRKANLRIVKGLTFPDKVIELSV